MPLLNVRHVQRPFEEQVQTHSKIATFDDETVVLVSYSVS